MYNSPRDRLGAMRDVERCLAEFCLVWSTARVLEACAPAEIKREFVFHLKALMEHAPARDRLDVSIHALGGWGRSKCCCQSHILPHSLVLVYPSGCTSRSWAGSILVVVVY